MTSDQLTRIVIIVVPVVSSVIADGRTTRTLLTRLNQRQDADHGDLEDHLLDPLAHRRRWRRRRRRP